ncbi:hypothetical protein Tco_1277911 [Tanacetum coccineum]
MKRMGFGEKLCQWVEICIRYSSLPIHVNGPPKEEFRLERGVRNGDPLSPFLFILAAEGLNMIVNEENAKCRMCILEWFEEVYGLQGEYEEGKYLGSHGGKVQKTVGRLERKHNVVRESSNIGTGKECGVIGFVVSFVTMTVSKPRFQKFCFFPILAFLMAWALNRKIRIPKVIGQEQPFGRRWRRGGYARRQPRQGADVNEEEPKPNRQDQRDLEIAGQGRRIRELECITPPF